MYDSLFFIRLNPVSESFDSTLLMTRNGFTKIDSNQLKTQPTFQSLDSNQLVTQLCYSFLVLYDLCGHSTHLFPWLTFFGLMHSDSESYPRLIPSHAGDVR